MYNDLLNIVITISFGLGCKVTTYFLKLYQLPMEKFQTQKLCKTLQINGLRKWE